MVEQNKKFSGDHAEYVYMCAHVYHDVVLALNGSGLNVLVLKVQFHKHDGLFNLNYVGPIYGL